MKRIITALIVLSIITVGCGQTAISNPTNTNKSNLEEKENPVQEEKQESEKTSSKISASEMIALTGSISEKKKSIVQEIQERGWYEKGMDFVPEREEFHSLVEPILKDTFTPGFIEEHIIKYRETFFCECDAPGALQGSMLPDFTKRVKYVDVNNASFTAYYPANDINSGAKFDIYVTKHENKWKIKDWTFMSSSYEEPFELTIKDVQAYFEKNGTPVTLQHTLEQKDERLNKNYSIFIVKQEEEFLAVDSRNWYIIRGKETIQQWLSVREDVFKD
ncbi:hypothetical protein KO561_15450 [Radiobacillus kanasensis]|uniref:hypothetical protein n=1 Tax=Radiobacillus kanasensis TaxID=2844358 RepID=UPI001E4DC03B|nr:hypothetical protein [Radiobacillus kanasensis]UFT98578.1 hypothetical protein KO561_15450 [Radiobacillus kanasensis]